MSKVLLIEDNQELAELIQAFLNKEGFSCFHCLSGEAAKEYLFLQTPQVIILDIMLPGIDGFAFCQYIRTTSQVPILMMSAKSSKTDKLLGFELGADDYMEKPVDTDIMCAKIRALIARHHPESEEPILISGGIKVDKQAHKVYLYNQLIDLNVKEYELLLLFIENKGKTLHKDFLFNQIWGVNSMSENQTLTVHIKMLRLKIEKDSRQPQRIQTVWGIGYRYEEI